MGARIEKAQTQPPPDREQIEAIFEREGLRPYAWGNAAGDRYEWHTHGHRKILYCISGSIVFHMHEEGDLAVEPGDRLEVDAGTAHAATVGSDGVLCLEAAG